MFHQAQPTRELEPSRVHVSHWHWLGALTILPWLACAVTSNRNRASRRADIVRRLRLCRPAID